MADICDVVEVTGDMDAGALATVRPAPVAANEAVGIGDIVTMTRIAPVLSASGDGASVALDVRRAPVLASNAQAVGLAIGTAAAADMAMSAARGWGLILSRLSNLVQVGGDAAATVPVNRPIPPVLGAGAAGTGLLLGVTLGSLAQAGAAGTGAIILTFKQLVVDDGTTGAGTILPGVMRNVAVASATGIGAAIQSATMRSLLEGAAAGSGSATDRADAVNLVDIDLIGSGEIAGQGWRSAWTAATDTFGMSRYEWAVPVRALAAVGDQLVLAGEDDVYLRAGKTDAGRPIAASVRSDLDNLGDDRLKRPDEIYVHYKGDGQARLLVGETMQYQETTHQHDLEQSRSASQYAHGRTQPGRGIRSLYFRITVQNIAGEALAVDGVTLTFTPTSRRV